MSRSCRRVRRRSSCKSTGCRAKSSKGRCSTPAIARIVPHLITRGQIVASQQKIQKAVIVVVAPRYEAEFCARQIDAAVGETTPGIPPDLRSDDISRNDVHPTRKQNVEPPVVVVISPGGRAVKNSRQPGANVHDGGLRVHL